ncbi:hypothetical protein TNCV_4141621 [Trichonephila clavipes]|nr:hypothetical protein TNCV_4141621 [Trichonephila clavipes]
MEGLSSQILNTNGPTKEVSHILYRMKIELVIPFVPNYDPDNNPQQGQLVIHQNEFITNSSGVYRSKISPESQNSSMDDMPVSVTTERDL